MHYTEYESLFFVSSCVIWRETWSPEFFCPHLRTRQMWRAWQVSGIWVKASASSTNQTQQQEPRTFRCTRYRLTAFIKNLGGLQARASGRNEGKWSKKKKLKPINKLKSLMEGVWSFSFSFFFFLINEIWALPLRTPQVGNKATLRVMTKGLGARMCLFRAFRARTSSDWVFQGGRSRNSKVSA